VELNMNDKQLNIYPIHFPSLVYKEPERDWSSGLRRELLDARDVFDVTKRLDS